MKKARYKLINTQLNKLKSAPKNKSWATLRTTKKNFQDEELLIELFLTTTTKKKKRNTFSKNML